METFLTFIYLCRNRGNMAVRKNPFKPFLDKVPAPMRNIYFLSLVLFFAFMIFVDKHDFLTNYRLQQTLNKLENDKVYYEEKMKEVRKDRRDIANDKEKFAREHYYLNKKDEDVFIIEKK